MRRSIFFAWKLSIILTVLVVWHSPVYGMTITGQVTFADGDAVVGARIKFIDEANGSCLFDHTDEEGMYEIILIETAVDEQMRGNAVPEGFTLLQNYPNPFNPGTVIPYRLVRAAHVHLAIYNVLGQRIRTLVDKRQGVGEHQVIWDSRNDQGLALGAGVYIYQIKIDGNTQSRKMVMMDGHVGNRFDGTADNQRLSKTTLNTETGFYTVLITGEGIVPFEEIGLQVVGDARSDFMVERAEPSIQAGKILVDNNDSNDDDQVPDFADGFNLDGILGNEDDINLSQQFVPLVVHIPRDIDLEQAIIRVTYHESIPADVVIHPEEPPVYEPAPGMLRIWAQPGDVERNSEFITFGGDFIIASEYHPEQLGLNHDNRTVTWYVEGIQKSTDLADQEIIIEIDPDGSGSADYELVRDVVRLTIIDIQFITKSPEGELVEQEFFYNCVPTPQIHASIEDYQVDDSGLVTMTISGTVTDQTSDIVSEPELQLRDITIVPENQEQYTIDLVNTGEPEYPWKPYKFQAAFSSTIQMQTHGEGDYRVVLRTSPNFAGVAAELGLSFIMDGNNVYSMAEEAHTSPGTFIPTILRIDAPEGTFMEGEYGFYAFDNMWAMEYHDFGDGDYYYAMDQMDRTAVFLPTVYSRELIPHLPIRKVEDNKFYLEVSRYTPSQGSYKVGFKMVNGVIGLIVWNDDVSTYLSKINNYTQTVFNVGSVKKYVYRPRPGWAGHTDNSLDTEIKWRYINNADTIHEFESKSLFEKDIAYRKKVVSTAKSVTFSFGAPVFNPVFWDSNLKVQPGKTASGAIADIFANQSKYTMACLLAAMSVVLEGVSSVYGSGTFDTAMGLDPYGNRWKVIETAIIPNNYNNNNENNAKYIPGDWGYIDNTDPNEPMYMEGENVIYMGGCFDLTFANFKKNADFWGHPIGSLKFDAWMAKVEAWSTSTTKDYMVISPIRTRIWLQ
ncbi:T9SS type A sorting domain-containing protein [Candidatus Omnitrophota bacterium]